jgi:hypothetical protein
MAEKGPDKEEIKVVDRRLFGADGRRREDIEEEPRPEKPAEEKPAGFERRPVEEPEGVDFTMLVNAMATQALLLLGEIPDPDGGKPVVHLEQARLQIDMLDLIRIKCRGNLTAVEEKLIEEVLYQLRMRCVAKSGSTG